MTASRRDAATPSGGRWTPGDAWRAARRALEVVAGVAMVALALALPSGSSPCWGAGAGVLRRRRERALDAA